MKMGRIVLNSSKFWLSSCRKRFQQGVLVVKVSTAFLCGILLFSWRSVTQAGIKDKLAGAFYTFTER